MKVLLSFKLLKQYSYLQERKKTFKKKINIHRASHFHNLRDNEIGP